MRGDIFIVRVEPRPIAVVQRRIPVGQMPNHIIKLLNIVYSEAKKGRFVQSGHNIAIYRPASGNMMDVEVGIEVEKAFDDLEEVKSGQTPGGEAATAVHMGSYDRMPHRAVIDWVKKSGRRLTGVSWEVYGDWSDDPAQRRTDIYHLLEPQ